MASKKLQILNIVLIGKTGHGKSATGNSILGRNAFVEAFSQCSVTQDCQLESAIFDNFQVNVVDTPGLEDTGSSQEDIMSKLLEVMSLSPEGFNAFILVLNASTRFTQEEFDAFDKISKFFGPEFLKVCTVVFTHGDKFEKKVQVPFDKWLAQTATAKENASLKTLLEKCNGRSVLLYNDNNFKKKNESEVNQLLTSISRRNVRYTHENFQKAANLRQKMAVESKLPQLESKYQIAISLITSELDVAEMTIDTLNDNHINKITAKIDNLMGLIAADDKGTGVLNIFKDEVVQLKSMVSGLKDKKCASEKLLKIKEYTTLLKNPPKKRKIVYAAVAVFNDSVNFTVSTISAVLFPPSAPLSATLAVASVISAGAHIHELVIEAQTFTEYKKKLKQLQEEAKRK